MGTYKQSSVLSSLNILAKILFTLLVCLMELSFRDCYGDF